MRLCRYSVAVPGDVGTATGLEDLVGLPSLLEADCHSVEQLRQLNRI
jgi:hypothetical protein